MCISIHSSAGRAGQPHCDVIITARKRSLGQGNIFRSVCHSVHRGGMSASPGTTPPEQTDPPSGTMYPPGLRTPQDYVPPPAGTTYPPGLCTPLGLRTPPGLHTPQDYVPPLDYIPPRLGLRTPPGLCTPPVDGLCAGGTHPTGMHSCFQYFLSTTVCHSFLTIDITSSEITLAVYQRSYTPLRYHSKY